MHGVRFQGKPGSLQLSCREKGRRFRDTRLLSSLTTTSNLMEESPIVQIQDKSTKKRLQEQIQAGTVREMQEREAQGTAPQTSMEHSPRPRSLHPNTPTASLPSQALSSHHEKTRSSSPEEDAGTTQRERQEQTEGDLKR